MQYHENTMNAYISLLDVKDVRIVKIALEAVEKRYGPLGFDITPYLKSKL